jgi:hypothetical protein
LGNLFFNIGQLTDYLITDQAPSLSKQTGKQDGVDFESFLNSITGGKSSLESLIPTDQPQPVFDILSSKPIMAQSASPAKPGMMAPMNFMQSFIPATSLIATTTAETSSLSSLSLTGQAGTAVSFSGFGDQGIESYDVQTIKVIDLKEILAGLPVPVKCEIDLTDYTLNNTVQQNPDNTNELNDLALKELTFKQPLVQLSTINLNSNTNSDNIVFDNIIKSDQLSQFTGISFDLNALVDPDVETVKVMAFTKDLQNTELTVPIDVLKDLANRTGQSMMVEAKIDTAPQTDSRNNLDDLLGSTGSSSKAIESEKYLLFDLKTLLNADDVDNIKVIIKSAAVNNVKADEIKSESKQNTIADFFANRNNNINIRSIALTPATQSGIASDLNAPLLDDIVTKFRNSAAVKQSTDDNKASSTHNNNKAESSAINNQATNTQELNSITKADNLVSRPGEQNVEFNNQTTGNLTTHTVAKSANGNIPATDMTRANELMANIDNITEQIRSRLQLAPGSSRMVIDLKPESLGKIKIDLNYQKDKVEAIFRVDNTEIKALLDAELPKLKSEMKLDSYRVEMNANDLHHDLHAQHGRRDLRDFNEYPKPGKHTVNKNDNINIIPVDNKPKTNRSIYARGGAVDLLV